MKLHTFPSRCHFLRAICLDRCVLLSAAVISPCAVGLGRDVPRPQHALPGNTLPPRDVVPLPGALTTHITVTNTESCECYRRRSFQAVNCNTVSRVQSLQATVTELAYWILVYYV